MEVVEKTPRRNSGAAVTSSMMTGIAGSEL